jgi:hypothetical protein
VKSLKIEPIYLPVAAVSTVLVLLAEKGTVNPIFVALGIGAVVLLKVVMTAARRVQNVSDRRLDHDLQMSLLDHQMTKPIFSVDSVIALGDSEYKEPTYQSRIPVMVATDIPGESLAKYN